MSGRRARSTDSAIEAGVRARQVLRLCCAALKTSQRNAAASAAHFDVHAISRARLRAACPLAWSQIASAYRRGKKSLSALGTGIET
jgi:hypothetical protein